MKHITKVEEGYELNIELNTKCGDYTVTGINMYVSEDADEGCGDLAVIWEVSDLENTGGGDMGNLLMRGDNDAVGVAMQHFYSKRAFTKQLQDILVAAGFSTDASNDVCGSEWGMQDEGRASYDASLLADEIRNMMQ